MTDKTRIRIAGLVTALFLAGISTAGLASHQHAPATLAPTAAVVQQPVRRCGLEQPAPLR